MWIVTLGDNTQITLPLPVQSVTWSSAVLRQTGSASVFVPAGSAAFSPTYIREEGATRVTLIHPDFGAWTGFALQNTFTAEGVQLDCAELAHAIQSRTVPEIGTIISCSAAQIIRMAAGAALEGASLPIYLKAFAEKPPPITYSLGGQNLGQVLGDMQSLSGQEWWMEKDGAFNWGAGVRSIYAPYLCEIADLVQVEKHTDVSAQAGRVRVRASDGKIVTAIAPEVYTSGWAQDRTISGTSVSFEGLKREADRELAIARLPQVDYTLHVRRTRLGDEAVNHWRAIAEGTLITCVLPSAGWSSVTVLLRVTQRAWSAGTDLLTVQTHVLPHVLPRGSWGQVSAPRTGNEDTIERVLLDAGRYGR